MTRDEFQREYHDYAADSLDEALNEAFEVNTQASGFYVFPVGPMLGKYCLMLDTAAIAVYEMGLLDTDAAGG